MDVATTKKKRSRLRYEKSIKKIVCYARIDSLFSRISSVASASITWDSWADWTGVGAIADVHAYTAQANEPYTYQITVAASLSNGDYRFVPKNPASSTDRVSLFFTSSSPVSSGTSYHEWITTDGGTPITKSIRFQ